MSETRSVCSPFDWTGRDLTQHRDWILELTGTEIDELEEAARTTLDRELPGLGREDFALPELDIRLSDMRDAVVDGIGLALVRGLPVDRWPRQVAARAFWAIGTRIGKAVCQNPVGHMLGHVKDIGVDAEDRTGAATSPPPTCRSTRISERKSSASSACQPAKSGGLSGVVGAGAIWNALVERRPDLAAELTRPFHIDRRGEETGDQKPYYVMPIFMPTGERMAINYVRRFIESGQRHDDVPALTARQREAMDLLDTVAAEPDLRLDMDFRPGDIQWVNNMTTLHTRTAYEDWPDMARRRHLYRLWLCVPDGWAVPDPSTPDMGPTPEPAALAGWVLPSGVRPNAPLGCGRLGGVIPAGLPGLVPGTPGSLPIADGAGFRLEPGRQPRTRMRSQFRRHQNPAPLRPPALGGP